LVTGGIGGSGKTISTVVGVESAVRVNPGWPNKILRGLDALLSGSDLIADAFRRGA
jgi:hypothetical protein